MHDSVTLHMAAPPDQVWDLVSDVTRIGSYSPETFEAEWIEGATGPAVGSRFRGHVKRNGIGPVYWTTCTVSACEPGKAFAFGVGNTDKPLNVWRYDIAGADGGSDVTESFNTAVEISSQTTNKENDPPIPATRNITTISLDTALPPQIESFLTSITRTMTNYFSSYPPHTIQRL